MPVSTFARFLLRAAVVLPLIAAPVVRAQTVYSEDFTGTSTTNAWYFFNGACLTAGTRSPGANPGQPPGCTGIGASYYNQNLVGGFNGTSGSAQTLPDPGGNGALRFTNGNPYGYSQNGAIVSAVPFPSTQGVQVTFKTVTYRGDSGGGGRDGADGMSFYLMDGSLPPGIGAWGGSLGYSCSNANPPYGGLVGAYLGLGIDEYGNFLNQGDNTASGFGYQWNRIGLRGYGNVAWPWLNANYPSYYPSSLTSAQQQAAVQSTCRTGNLWNYSVPAAPRPVLNALRKPLTVPDYAAIPGAYKVLAGLQIANESAIKRSQATPILYQLKITADGLLSLAYSVNGGALQSVITRQNIANSNGPMPAS
ncbi:MAG: pilus assembly protein PilY, partial [Gammaproteobacteria bacterium]|nr:pilus assembly protein PilY [Gammaproteobacteria bacterium]